jgi:hypothetical protein
MTEGIIVLDIFEGSVTKEQFLSFMREHMSNENTQMQTGHGSLNRVAVA